MDTDTLKKIEKELDELRWNAGDPVLDRGEAQLAEAFERTLSNRAPDKPSGHRRSTPAPIRAPWDGAEQEWLAQATGKGWALEALNRASEDTDEDADLLDSVIQQATTAQGLDQAVATGPLSTAVLPPKDQGLSASRVKMIGLGAAAIIAVAAALGWAVTLKARVDELSRQKAALGAEIATRDAQIDQVRSITEARIGDLEQRVSELLTQPTPQISVEPDPVAEALQTQTLQTPATGRRQTTDDATDEAPAREKEAPEAKTPVAAAKPANENPAPPEENEETEVSGLLLAPAPARDQVKAVMDSIAPDIKACAKGQTGQVTVRFAVSGATGVVLSSEVYQSAFEDPSVGACAASAVRHAQFPRFSRDKLIIKYPFEV